MRGSVTQVGPDRWRVAISLRFDTDGKRRRKFRRVQGTREDAERELTQLLAAADGGMLPMGDGRVTVAAFLDGWLDDLGRTGLRPRTREQYGVVVRKHLVPVLGTIRLGQLQRKPIKAMEAAMLARGLAPATVAQTHRVLVKALNDAIEDGFLKTNPAKFRAPAVPERELHVLDEDGARSLIDAARGTWLHVPVLLGLATGLRRGEVLGLRWADVDLDRGEAHVAVQLQAAGGALGLVPLKTKKAKRNITLPATVVGALRAHHAEQATRRLKAGPGWQETDLISDRGDGRPVDPATLTHSFKALARRCGHPELRLHDLRHTHATLLMARGIHPLVVSERLGHTRVGITLDRYSHVTRSMQAEAAIAAEELLGEQGRQRA